MSESAVAGLRAPRFPAASATLFGNLGILLGAAGAAADLLAVRRFSKSGWP